MVAPRSHRISTTVWRRKLALPFAAFGVTIGSLCHVAWVNGSATRNTKVPRTRVAGKGALHDRPTGGAVSDGDLLILHQRYNDAMVEYTQQNFEWVEKKLYGIDMLLSPEEQDEIWQASRERLFRYPQLQDRDMHQIGLGKRSPQRFVSDAIDAEAAGDPGDNVFIINLPRRPAKLRHALHEIHTAGISATFVDAIDGDTFVCQQDMDQLGVNTLPNYVGHQNTLPFLTSGQLGCFMSHYTVFHYMVENNIPSALILEDDFDLQEDFAQRLGQFLEEAHASGEEWNLMYLGRSPTEGDWRVISEHLVEPGYTRWTVAYILKLEVAQAFVEQEVHRNLAPLDHYFSVSMGKGFDLHWNENAVEWAQYIPQVMKGLAVTPPLVMPYIGSMFLSDTAMLRKGTKYMKDLPVQDPGISP